MKWSLAEHVSVLRHLLGAFFFLRWSVWRGNNHSAATRLACWRVHTSQAWQIIDDQIITSVTRWETSQEEFLVSFLTRNFYVYRIWEYFHIGIASLIKHGNLFIWNLNDSALAKKSFWIKKWMKDHPFICYMNSSR